MPLARRRGESGMNYWPGFVDALSTLILGIIFLLTVFVVVQFYLQQEVAGKDTALTRLNAQIAELTSLLSLEKAGKSDLESQLAALRATLASTESERDKHADDGWSFHVGSPRLMIRSAQRAGSRGSSCPLSCRSVSGSHPAACASPRAPGSAADSPLPRQPPSIGPQAPCIERPAAVGDGTCGWGRFDGIAQWLPDAIGQCMPSGEVFVPSLVFLVWKSMSVWLASR